MQQRYDKSNPPMTSAETLLGSEEAATELNGDLTASLAYSGLTREQITLGEGYLPLHKVIAFLNHAAASLACENFGIAVARHQPPARFAVLGQLVRFAPDLGQAIADAIRFSILNSQYSMWSLEKNGTTTMLVRHVRVHLNDKLNQMQSLALAVTYKAMSAICQQRVPIAQVRFSHSQPTAHEEVTAFFHAPVLYDQAVTGLVFADDTFSMPIPTSNAQVRRMLTAHLEDLASTDAPDAGVVTRMRRELRQTVGSRRCTLEGIAQSWGTHPRGLQRRLRDEGTSFRELLGAVRQELAEEYLKNSSVAVLELADFLGYRNASAFSRAFKLRTGMAPDHWRAKNV